MAAPTTVRTQAGNLLNLLWDAFDAGTAFDRDWEHDAVEVSVSGRRVLLHPRAERYADGRIVITLIVKRL